jgi:tRNA-2-methylthio-N6-dimethylallyladenosine synthase
VKLFPDDVSREEKRRRWDVLQAIMEDTVKAKNQAYLGKTVSVLVERIEGGLASGQSNEMKLTRFPSADLSLIGKVVPVKVVQALEWQLLGELVS